MLNPRGARSGRLVRFAVAASAALLAAPAAASADTYIVQFKDAPLASYTGGKQGIPATSPLVTGRKLKADSANGLDYRSFLAGRQKAVLDRLSGGKPDVVSNYRFAFAGFAAQMSAEQASKLKKDPDVARVWKDELLHPTQAPGIRTLAWAASTATARPTCASPTRPRACGRPSAARPRPMAPAPA